MDLENITNVLREKGIQKGQAEADRIVEEAKEKAASILKDAEEEKAGIIEAARKEGEDLDKQFQSQMKLTGRDFVLGLHKTLEETLALKPLRDAIRDALSESDYIKRLIGSMVEQYVEADSRGRHRELTISVPEAMKEDLMKDLLGRIREHLELAPTIQVGAGAEGFSFTFGEGGAVVINVESLMEAVKPFISQKFHEFLQVGQ